MYIRMSVMRLFCHVQQYCGYYPSWVTVVAKLIILLFVWLCYVNVSMFVVTVNRYFWEITQVVEFALG